MEHVSGTSRALMRCSRLRPLPTRPRRVASAGSSEPAGGSDGPARYPSRSAAAAWSNVMGPNLLGVGMFPGLPRTRPTVLSAGSLNPACRNHSGWKSAQAARPERDNLDHLTHILRRQPQFPLRFLILLDRSSQTAFFKSRSNLASAHRLGPGYRRGWPRRRIPRPSIACSTSSASTVRSCPGLHGWSRPSEPLASGLEVRVRSEAREKARLLAILVALADEVVDENLAVAVGARNPFCPCRSIRPLALLEPVGVHGIS